VSDPLMPRPSVGVVATSSWTGGALPAVDLQRVPGRRFPAVPALAADQSWQLPPVALQGQVVTSTTFGAALSALAQRPDVHLVLESGTWYGGGSSWCLAKGLRSQMSNPARPDRWLMTLEIFEPAHEYASQTLARMPATCLRGGTVGIEGYATAEEARADPDYGDGEHFRLYYERDKALAASAPRLLPALCAAYDFDVVLLDGNEYTGRAEFEIVDSLCKPHFLALHDCRTLKTRAVEALLAARPLDWKLVSSGRDSASWAVYENLKWRA